MKVSCSCEPELLIVTTILESSSPLVNLGAIVLEEGASPALCFSLSAFSFSLVQVFSEWMVKRLGAPSVMFFFVLRYRPEEQESRLG